MSLDSIRHHAEPVLEVFRSNNRSDQILALETLLGGLDWPNNRAAVLEEIVRRCGIRAWGDLYVEDMSWQDWLDLLGNLKDAAQRELDAIEARASRPADAEDIAGALRRRRREVRSAADVARPKRKTAARVIGAMSSTFPGLSTLRRYVQPMAWGLLLVFLFASAMSLWRAPDFSETATTEVSGGFKRTEPVTGGHSAKRPAATSRIWLFLDKDPVVYGLANPDGLGWLSVLSRIDTGDRLTLVVDGDDYAEARRIQDKIRRRMRETSDVGQFGQLASRSVVAGKSHPVKVVEMRRADEVIYSRRAAAPSNSAGPVPWILIALAALAALVGLKVVERRFAASPEPAE